VKKSGPGIMSRVGESMRNMASSWMLKSREPEFQEMADYTKAYREKMISLETISDKIAKDRFGKIYTHQLWYSAIQHGFNQNF